MLVSIVAHMLVIGGAIVLPVLMPRAPALRLADGFAVVLPRGGDGTPTARLEPAPAPVAKPAPESQRGFRLPG